MPRADVKNGLALALDALGSFGMPYGVERHLRSLPDVAWALRCFERFEQFSGSWRTRESSTPRRRRLAIGKVGWFRSTKVRSTRPPQVTVRERIHRVV